MLFLTDFCVKIFYVSVEIHHSPLIAHSSFLACNISSQKTQCGAPIKLPHCICSRTALSLPTHRIAFFRSPLIFRSCWTRFCISLEPFLFFSADRSWNLRLSESRDMLVWTLPSVSKLNNVKQVQDDHQLCSVVFCYIEELVFLLTFMFLRLDMAHRWHWYDRWPQILSNE